jgi:hypothetical protein
MLKIVRSDAPDLWVLPSRPLASTRSSPCMNASLPRQPAPHDDQSDSLRAPHLAAECSTSGRAAPRVSAAGRLSRSVIIVGPGAQGHQPQRIPATPYVTPSLGRRLGTAPPDLPRNSRGDSEVPQRGMSAHSPAWVAMHKYTAWPVARRAGEPGVPGSQRREELLRTARSRRRPGR